MFKLWFAAAVPQVKVFLLAFKWVILAIFALLIFCGGFATSYKYTTRPAVAKIEQMRAEAAAQAEQARQTEVGQKQITNERETANGQNTTVIKYVYRRLREHARPSPCTMPTIPDAATDPDEVAEHYVSVAPDLAEGCAHTTQTLVDLQTWVADQKRWSDAGNGRSTSTP